MRIRWRGFELPTEVVVDQDTLTDRYGKFLIEPFERGFGTTVGNSLRRVLLSSLEGAAITSATFDGVMHEFTTIDGVLEDVADIVLNLKQVRIHMMQDQPTVLRLDLDKEGPVTGGDLRCEAGVEVANPDLLICTITEKRRLTAEFEVHKGRGYRTADENEPEEEIAGRLAVDSIFSPVLRVRFHTEDTRVGQRTNYDRLVLEIWTDATVLPHMALVEAAKILRKHLTPFVEYSEIGGELAESAGAEEVDEIARAASEDLRQKMGMEIEELGLSARSLNCLQGADIRTVGALVQHAAEDLLKVRNFGKTSLDEVVAKLTEIGLELGVVPGAEPAGEEES